MSALKQTKTRVSGSHFSPQPLELCCVDIPSFTIVIQLRTKAPVDPPTRRAATTKSAKMPLVDGDDEVCGVGSPRMVVVGERRVRFGV